MYVCLYIWPVDVNIGNIYAVFLSLERKIYDLVLVHGMEFLLFHAFILQLLILKRVKRSMCGMKER